LPPFPSPLAHLHALKRKKKRRRRGRRRSRQKKKEKKMEKKKEDEKEKEKKKGEKKEGCEPRGRTRPEPPLRPDYRDTS
jgi:hypothetical protein